jgi:hypothetical protein
MRRSKGIKEGGRELMTLLKYPCVRETCGNVAECRGRGRRQVLHLLITTHIVGL